MTNQYLIKKVHEKIMVIKRKNKILYLLKFVLGTNYSFEEKFNILHSWAILKTVILGVKFNKKGIIYSKCKY